MLRVESINPSLWPHRFRETEGVPGAPPYFREKEKVHMPEDIDFAKYYKKRDSKFSGMFLANTSYTLSGPSVADTLHKVAGIFLDTVVIPGEPRPPLNCRLLVRRVGQKIALYFPLKDTERGKKTANFILEQMPGLFTFDEAVENRFLNHQYKGRVVFDSRYNFAKFFSAFGLDPISLHVAYVLDTRIKKRLYPGDMEE